MNRIIENADRRLMQHELHRQSMHPSRERGEIMAADLERTIPARFAAIVARFGDRLAVKSGTHSLTYRELDYASNQVAHALLQRLGPGSEPVVTLMERDVWRHVAHHGILKAGKCFVPLALHVPPDRLGFILHDLGHPPVVTDLASLDRISWPAGHNAGAVAVVEELLEHASGLPVSVDIAVDAPCLIRYTSGSTGRPKGVVSSHRDLLHDASKSIHLSALCHLDCITHIGAEGSFHIKCALVGATFLEVSLYTIGMPAVVEFLASEPVTVLVCTVTGFRQLRRTAGSDLVFPHLRCVAMLGEPPTPRDIATARGMVPTRCVFSNQYGSTEAYIAATYYATVDSAAQLDTLPSGYAVQNVEIVLFDETGQPVPAGEIGEIAVRSRYLTQGYWRQPELTAQRYLPDPEGSDTRMYFTGDLGRMDPDGCLYYMGRKDFQVKIRSHRVLITEVEDLLRTVAGVKDAAVVARPGPNGDLRLVAYLEAAAEKPTVSELRQALSLRLPVVPAQYVFLDKLPLTVSQKVNRLALPDPGNRRPALDVPYAAPRTPVEILLAAIWAEVLGLDQVGIHDSFLDLGGDSLLASQVVTRVVDQMQLELLLATLYGAPTVSEMALAIAQTALATVSPAELEHLLAAVEGSE